jgi:hypothetical protein
MELHWRYRQMDLLKLDIILVNENILIAVVRFILIQTNIICLAHGLVLMAILIHFMLNEQQNKQQLRSTQMVED